MNSRMATLLTTLAAATVVLSTIGVRPVPRYLWNASESVPIGLYQLRPAGRLAVTDLVAVLPLEPLATLLAEGNYLPRNVPMLKRVMALPGQMACRDHLTITVDNVPTGEAREHDSRGHPLPIWQGCHVIADGEVFLMNWQSADSFDGRYFGVLSTNTIIGKATPLWTSEEE